MTNYSSNEFPEYSEFEKREQLIQRVLLYASLSYTNSLLKFLKYKFSILNQIRKEG